MTSQIVIFSTSGNWEPEAAVILDEGADDSQGVQASALTEAEFYTVLGTVSRKIDLPVGENIRSTVRALKGRGTKGDAKS